MIILLVSAAQIIEMADRTKSVAFGTGLQCSNQPLCKRTRYILKQEASQWTEDPKSTAQGRQTL